MVQIFSDQFKTAISKITDPQLRKALEAIIWGASGFGALQISDTRRNELRRVQGISPRQTDNIICIVNLLQNTGVVSNLFKIHTHGILIKKITMFNQITGNQRHSWGFADEGDTLQDPADFTAAANVVTIIPRNYLVCGLVYSGTGLLPYVLFENEAGFYIPGDNNWLKFGHWSGNVTFFLVIEYEEL